MKNSINRPNFVNGIGAFQSVGALHDLTSARCRPSK